VCTNCSALTLTCPPPAQNVFELAEVGTVIGGRLAKASLCPDGMAAPAAEGMTTGGRRAKCGWAIRWRLGPRQKATLTRW
jgi:hypothetical protein